MPAHPEIDGSGTVAGQAGTHPSASARVDLRDVDAIGIKYSMVNTVIDYEENRRISWQTRPGGLMGRFVAGRIWRYELEPAEGGTRVRESWDISQDHQRALLRLGGLPEKTRQNMEKASNASKDLVTAKG